MDLTHYRAVLSFCPDLTDPAAVSIPMGVLLLADSPKVRIAMVAVAESPLLREVVDPITREMLATVPQMLERQVRLALDGDGASASADEILATLCHTLRNTLYVSRIYEAGTFQLPEDAKAASAKAFHRLNKLMDETIFDEMEAAGFELLPESSSESYGSHDPSPTFPIQGMAKHYWPLPAARHASDAVPLH